MSTMTRDISFSDDTTDYDLGVEFEYYPASRGSRERGTGLQLEPDEPEDIEIIKLWDNETEQDVTEALSAFNDRIIELIWDKLCQERSDSYFEQDER